MFEPLQERSGIKNGGRKPVNNAKSEKNLGSNGEYVRRGKKKTRRRASVIMRQLVGLVRPLLGRMSLAILFGVLGFLCAIFLTIFAVQAVLVAVSAFQTGTAMSASDWKTVHRLLTLLCVAAALRGVLHYLEQYCNHYIAFRLLAILRHKVFAALRKLCPAKLEGRDKGNLIALITTDIELLEVFYAHTISPIAIAVLTSAFMTVYQWHFHWAAGILALSVYLLIGAAIPLWNDRRSAVPGMEFREEFGDLNSFVLDSLHGLDEILQYGQGEVRRLEMARRSQHLAKTQRRLRACEGHQRVLTMAVVLFGSLLMTALSVLLYRSGQLSLEGLLLCPVALMGSFGPVLALSALSNHLNQTLASGERVLSLLEETPLVEEVPDRGATVIQIDKAMCLSAQKVQFSYDEECILRDCSIAIAPGKITGIHGPSGSGKSTLLKLFMRFWDVQSGAIHVQKQDVRTIPTHQLRQAESYMTQETHLFHDSIARNIGLAKRGATQAEIEEAAKKASIHDFILSLPKGYDTEVGELGDTLSGGERQRIGLARAFLHDAPVILLDEPTSNLDPLNEGVILKSLRESAADKTVVLISHRASTMRAADIVIEMETMRQS